MKFIDKDILKLAIPSILANITVPIVGMVDMSVAGHLEGAAQTMIGGITIGSVLFDLLYWNFGFLRAGTGGLTAQAVGRNDNKECANVFARAFGIALLCASVLLLVQGVFLNLAFKFFDCTPEVRELASKYFLIRIWAAPATLSLMAFKGWFIGMQDTLSSMITDLVVNGTNIIMSIVLAFGLHCGQFYLHGIGFSGIALGTLIAQYMGLLTAFILLQVKYRKRIFHSFKFRDFVSSFRGGEMGRFFMVNTSLFVRSLCIILIYIGFTKISTGYGTMLMDVGAILMKLLMIFSFFTDGFAYAGEALSGKYIGARDRHMFQLTVRHTFAWSMAVAGIFVVLYYLAGVPMLQLITSDEMVISATRPYLWWLLLMPFFGCAAFTWDGIYVGATSTKSIMWAMVWATVAFFLTYYVGLGILNLVGSESMMVSQMSCYEVLLHLLMGAYFMHLFIRTIYLSINYNKNILRNNF